MSRYAAAVAAIAAHPYAYACGRRAAGDVKPFDISELLAANDDTITRFIDSGEGFNVAFYLGFAEGLTNRG